MRNQQIFDSLGRLFRKDLIIGGFVGCAMIISALAAWGFYNQNQAQNCNKNFLEYTRSLQERTEQKYERDKRESDSVRQELKKELEKIRNAKEEVERQLLELKKRS